MKQGESIWKVDWLDLFRSFHRIESLVVYFIELFWWMTLFWVAFCSEEESAYDLSLKEAFGEKAKYGGEQQTKKVIEPAHISEHHENVVDDAFLVLNFVWELDINSIEFGTVKRFAYIFIKIQIVYFFRRREPHKI